MELDSRQNQLMRNNRYEFSHNRDIDLKNIFLHSHDFYELYFFISGNAEYSVEALHYNLVSGDIMLIAPNHLHQLEVLSENQNYERIVLWINPNYMKKLSTKQTDLSKCFEICSENKTFLLRDYFLSQKVRALLLQIEQLEIENAFGSDIEKEVLVRQILLAVNRFFHDEKYDSKVINARYAKSSNQIVSKAIDFIEKNLDGDLSLDNISQNIFVSKFYLARVFKTETNTGIHQFVTKKRLILSKSLIEEGWQIKELYSKCGFNDESSFFRAFKTEFNITPNQYRSLINR